MSKLTYFEEERPKGNVFSMAFYNLENLYDIFNDPETLDDDFTVNGKKKWTYNKYKNKIQNLSEIIAKIGLNHSTIPPVVLGVAEVENEQVIMDLIHTEKLASYQYDYVHDDSPDERGIDVAFLYQKEHFELLDAKVYPVIIMEPDGDRDFTRDILMVHGRFLGEEMFFIVNHWPSRTAGTEETNFKRKLAASRVLEIMDEIRVICPEAKVVVMGDFNDEPTDESMQLLIKNDALYNVCQSLKDKGAGTSYSQKRWYLFDQMLVTHNFFDRQKDQFTFKYLAIYNTRFIKTWRGKRKNAPFRTFIGRWHQGGYSDHFPIYAFLEKQ